MAEKKPRKGRTTKDGRPWGFQPGNKIGPRFPPGNIANPHGRPRTKALKEAIERQLDKEVPLTLAQSMGIPAGTKFLDALVSAAILRAMQKGGAGYFRELADRLDGKVPLPLRLGAQTDDESLTELRLEIVQARLPRPKDVVPDRDDE